MSGCVAIIPARLSSTRIKEKPIADICGKPLVQWVYERACNLKNVDDVVIAADSEKIADVVRSFGGKCELTPSDLKSGSDRVYYTSEKYFSDAGVIVNIQGDEPFIDTGIVDSMIERIKNEDTGLYSAYFPVDKEEASDISNVKVVIDKDSYALYFSRSMIPYNADVYNKHLGIYVWKKEALKEFHNTEPSVLEITEKLEQMRVLENGGRIKMMKSPCDSVGIDTPEDLEKAKRWINEN